jgi:ribosomal protein L7/L12
MPKLPPEALIAWRRGDMVEAIRVARLHTGLGLKEAMQALESGAHEAIETSSPKAVQLPPEVHLAISRGNLIEAIKLARNAKGLSLAEAKTLLEQAMHAEHRPSKAAQHPAKRPGLAPGEVPRTNAGSYVLYAILLLLLVAGLYHLRG